MRRWPLLVLVVSLAACGGTPVPSRSPSGTVPSPFTLSSPVPSPPAEIAMPWRPVPITPSLALLEKVDDGCAEMPRSEFKDGVPPRSVVDIRGGGLILAVYEDGSRFYLCHAIWNGNRIGDALWPYQAFTPWPMPAQPIVSASSLDISTESLGNLPGAPQGLVTRLHGRAGDAISSVVIVREDGVLVQASLVRARFAAWWPGDVQPALFRGFDANGTLIDEVEAP